MRRFGIIVACIVCLLALTVWKKTGAQRAMAPMPPAIVAVAANSEHPVSPRPRQPTPPKLSVREQFSNWAAKYVACSNLWEKEAMVSEGEKLAQARREALRELIRSNPEKALAQMLPYETRKALPDSIQGLIEQPVSGRGELQVVASVSAENPSVIRTLELNGRTYEAYVYGWRSRQLSSKKTAVHGMSIGDSVAIAEDPVRILSAAESSDQLATNGNQIEGTAEPPVVIEVGGQLVKVESESQAVEMNRTFKTLQMSESGIAPASALGIAPPVLNPSRTQGRKTVLFIRVRYPDDPREPISESRAYQMMSDVSDFFIASSYNSLSLVTTVTPAVMMPQPKEYYRSGGKFAGTLGGVVGDARAAAKVIGFDWTEFDMDLMFSVDLPKYTASDHGVSLAGGRLNVFLEGANAADIARGFSFNFGLLHANSWRTGHPPDPPNPNDPQPNFPIDVDGLLGHEGIDVPGYDVTDGDPWDWMGKGPFPRGQYNTIARYFLQWLPEESIRRITQSETNRLYAFDTGQRIEGRFRPW